MPITAFKKELHALDPAKPLQLVQTRRTRTKERPQTADPLRLERDVRVSHGTILVTYYNAPNAELWRTHDEDFPEKLRQQGIEPRIPWRYDFHLDFRFK